MSMPKTPLQLTPNIVMQRERSTSYRGLRNFIYETSSAVNDEELKKRVQHELGHIRQQFTNPRLNDYDRRKYTYKLMYIFLLGFNVDFGYLDAAQLAASRSKQNKIAGYAFLSILCSSNYSFVQMLTSQLFNDLQGDTLSCSLALNTIATLASPTLASTLARPVFDLLLQAKRPDGTVNKTVVRKKAALAFLALHRADPAAAALTDDDAAQVVALLNVRNVGLLTSLLSLFTEFAMHPPTPTMVPLMTSHRTALVHLLGKIRRNEVSPDHKYLNTVPCPWLQHKLLRLLRLLPPPKPQTDPEDYQQLVKCLSSIFLSIDFSKEDCSRLHTRRAHTNSIRFAIFKEALSLGIHVRIDAAYIVGGHNGDIGEAEAAANAGVDALDAAEEAQSLDDQEKLQRRRASSKARLEARRRMLADPKLSTIGRIGSAVDSASPNFRYVGLQCLTELAADPRLTKPLQHFIPVVAPMVERETDTAVRLRALYLLYRIASDAASAAQVIEPLIAMLRAGVPAAVAETVVMVVSVLAERFMGGDREYFDTVISLVSAAAEAAPRDVVGRLCTAADAADAGTRLFAAEKAYELIRIVRVQPVLVRVASTVLGQHGAELVAAGIAQATDIAQAVAAAARRSATTPTVLAACLNGLAHFVAAAPAAMPVLQELVEEMLSHYDTEVQETAIRIHTILTSCPDLFSRVFAQLPAATTAAADVAAASLAARLGEDYTVRAVPVAPAPSAHPLRAPALMLGASSGVLLETPVLQIGAKVAVDTTDTTQLHADIYLGNKMHADLEPDSLELSVHVAGALPRSIPARRQLVVPLSADADTLTAVAERDAACPSGPAAVAMLMLEHALSLRVFAAAAGIDVRVFLPLTAGRALIPVPTQVVDKFGDPRVFSQSWAAMPSQPGYAEVHAALPAPADITMSDITQRLGLPAPGLVAWLPQAAPKPGVLPFLAAGRPQTVGARPVMVLGCVIATDTQLLISVRATTHTAAAATLQGVVVAVACACSPMPTSAPTPAPAVGAQAAAAKNDVLADLLGAPAPGPVVSFAAPAPAPAPASDISSLLLGPAAAPAAVNTLDLLAPAAPAPAPALAPAASSTADIAALLGL